jgi:hypothetical protein
MLAWRAPAGSVTFVAPVLYLLWLIVVFGLVIVRTAWVDARQCQYAPIGSLSGIGVLPLRLADVIFFDVRWPWW